MNKKTSILKYLPIIIFFMIFLALIWSVIFFYAHKSEPKLERLTQKDPIISSIAQQFDSGSKEHIQLRNFAMHSLHFPVSYKHIETIYFKNEEKKTIVVQMQFSGRDIYNTERKSCLRATYTYYAEEIIAPSSCD